MKKWDKFLFHDVDIFVHVKHFCGWLASKYSDKIHFFDVVDQKPTQRFEFFQILTNFGKCFFRDHNFDKSIKCLFYQNRKSMNEWKNYFKENSKNLNFEHFILSHHHSNFDPKPIN